MSTITMPNQFVTFNEKGEVKDIDIYGFLNYIPEKQKLEIIIKLLKKIQEEQYQGFKKFANTTPINNSRYKDAFEDIGRMYFVIHSIEDNFNKL